MDNREFAKVLLYEATDLLTESAGRNGYESRKLEEKLKLAKRKKSENEEYAKERGLSPDILPGHDKTKKDISKLEKVVASDKEFKAGVKSNAPWASTTGWERAARSRGTLRAIEERRQPLTSKQKKLHEKINDRAKKAQNESIAILLTEAALLLNDED